MYQVRGTRYGVRGAGYEVWGTGHEVRGTRHAVWGMGYVVQSTSAWHFKLSWYKGCGNVAQDARHKTQSIKGKQMRCEVHNLRQCFLNVWSNDSFFYGTVNLVLQYFSTMPKWIYLLHCCTVYVHLATFLFFLTKQNVNFQKSKAFLIWGSLPNRNLNIFK